MPWSEPKLRLREGRLMPALHNTRHEKFAQALAAGTGQVKAYIGAGFSKNGADGAAWKVSDRPDVKARIAEILQSIAGIAAKANAIAVKALAITREDVLRELWDNAMRGKAGVPVLDREGKPIGEYRTELSASNKALELFGKEAHGMFIDRRETGKPNQFAELTEAELDAEIAAREAILRAAKLAPKWA